MNTLELKPGNKIGVFYHDSSRLGTKAEIEEVERVSPTGYVTLKNGKRYTPKGKEIDPLGDPTHLCSVERAQEATHLAAIRQQQKEEERRAYLASPEGKRKMAICQAAKAAIQTLNQHGWYADVDGHMDVVESEIKQIVERYVSEHETIS